jgi:hypothetical protein
LEDGPLLASEIALEEPISSEGDGMGFAAASGVELHGDRLVVLETGNDRLVVFDDRYRPARWIGREGAGPGELRGPVGLAAWQSEYAVVEVNNARVSVFDTSGAFIRSFNVPNGFSNIGYGPDGRIYVNAHDQENYLLVAGRDGTLRPFGSRPRELYPADVLAVPRARMGGYVRFAVTRDGRVHAYDPVLAALVSFDPDGRRVDLRRLPASVIEGLRRRAAVVARDFGGGGIAPPANITELSLSDEGRLLLLFPTTELIGLLVDPGAGTARPIRWAPGADPTLSGFGGIVRGGVFYRLSTDDLRLFRIGAE